MNSPNEIVFLLETYKYLFLLPLAIIEGPIVAIIVGFLTTLKVFDTYISYAILVVGDVIGDSSLYALGRWGTSLLHRHGSRKRPQKCQKK